MKKNIIIIIVVVSVILSVVAAWFIFNSNNSNAIVADCFIDLTDKDSNRLQGSQIIDVAINGQNTSNTITIRLHTLSHYHTNDVQVFSLPKESFTMGNSFERKRAIRKLGKQLDSALVILYNQQSAKDRSYIFLPLINCLNELSEAKNAKNKILICCSDMLEHSDEFDSYSPSGMRMLKNNPKKVEKILLQGNTLSNIKGISVYIVHSARSHRDDILSIAMQQSLYKRLYESRGAKVYIQSNLHIQ